jgi:hypothetical protein
MKRLGVGLASTRAILVLVAALFALTGASATASNGNAHQFNARLDGFQEVPSKLTNGTGTFRAVLSPDGTQLSYTLTYSGLSTSALAAHIHFAQSGVSGGIFAFLCGGGGKPACLPAGGTVTGTIMATDIVAPVPDQGLAAGDLAGAVRALRSGDTYTNVHTTRFPQGEIRGQIQAGGEDGSSS